MTLVDNVMHATGPNDENARSDHQPGLLDHRCGRLDSHRHADVTFDDDAPTLTHIANAIIANEDNNIVVGLHDFAFGADGEQSIEVTPLTPISGLTYLTPVHNADGSVDLKAQVSGADFFDLRINPDGTYLRLD